jgi:hypothetical protein
MSSFPLKCYYCNQSDFGSVDRYERYVVVHHPDLPGYPGPADIALYDLKKQDMSWEKEVKAMELARYLLHGQNNVPQ